jgi:hypothetical protein
MNELVTLKKIEQSKLAISEVKNLNEIKMIIDQGEALKAYARSAQMSAEIQADIAELNLRAQRRLGEISAGLEKAKPGVKPKQLLPDGGSNSKTETLSSVGIDIRRAIEAEMLATVPENVFEQKIAEAKEASEKITKSLFDEIQRKQSIIKSHRAFERVAEYRKTGIKPEGWIDGADDDLNKELEEGDARHEAYMKKLAEKQKQEAIFQNDEFPSYFQKYLAALDSDIHRLVICKKVMTICRQTLATLQIQRR